MPASSISFFEFNKVPSISKAIAFILISISLENKSLYEEVSDRNYQFNNINLLFLILAKVIFIFCYNIFYCITVLSQNIFFTSRDPKSEERRVGISYRHL